jgi:signal transduction histidine kinase
VSSIPLRPPLVRPRAAVLGGVSAALAEHLRMPLFVVRLAFICLVFVGGGGALFYLWLWALVPLRPVGDGEALTSRRVPVAALLFIATGIAGLVDLAGAIDHSDATVTFSLLVAIAAGGGAVAWTLAMDASDPLRTGRYGVVVRTASTLVLLLAGIVALLMRPTITNAVLGLVAVVVAVGVSLAPRIVTLWTQLITERSARAVDEQRAEMAAHLHDSVLQTLALIQTRAGSSSEIARIARAQERELRDWLFDDDQPATEDLVTTLREGAASIELDFPARIEVVAVGEPLGRPHPALVGAAREAMLNSARHAGGDISVYVETTRAATDVFIRDRGPGVDLAALPDDRLGIRESIIGRMSRAGGLATVTRTEPGTEVHLHLEAARA